MTPKIGMTAQKAIKLIKDCGLNIEQPLHDRVADCIITVLEKQIPKKPVNYDSVPHSRCPVCNNAVKVFKDAHEYHYCLYCGQALDWSEENGST